MSVEVTNFSGYSATSPTDGALLFRRKGQADGVGPAVVAIHGHGADSLTWIDSESTLAPGRFCRYLAEEGYRVIAIDDGGGTTWGDQASVDRIADAVAWMQAARGAGMASYLSSGGAKSGKVGLMGWSMGAMAVLNYLKRNKPKVGAAWLWAPVTDLDWARAQAAWTAEVDAAFGGNYALNAPGYKVADEPATFRGVAPIKLAHAADDATVPQSKSTSFVAAVNDPLVTMRNVATGGHSGAFQQVPVYETLQFFNAVSY